MDRWTEIHRGWPGMVLECQECHRTFDPAYIYLYPDGSVKCVPCAGKRINLLGRKPAPKRPARRPGPSD